MKKQKPLFGAEQPAKNRKKAGLGAAYWANGEERAQPEDFPGAEQPAKNRKKAGCGAAY